MAWFWRGGGKKAELQHITHLIILIITLNYVTRQPYFRGFYWLVFRKTSGIMIPSFPSRLPWSAESLAGIAKYFPLTVFGKLCWHFLSRYWLTLIWAVFLLFTPSQSSFYWFFYGRRRLTHVKNLMQTVLWCHFCKKHRLHRWWKNLIGLLWMWQTGGSSSHLQYILYSSLNM